MTSTDYVVWFQDYHPSDKPRVGGKNASLGEMIAAGLPVPPGFALTTEAYHTLREHSDMRSKVNRALAGVEFSDPVGLRRIAAFVRSLIEEVPMPLDIDEQIRRAYGELCNICGIADVPVAVRSSATAEDLPDASFAGQQDTYLWITGEDAVVENVQRCWSSIFTDRAIAYRHETGHDHEIISMSVGVQMMVQPKAAGVAFTLNPSDGDRSQIAIDASWGFGESVVSGEVTPDNFLVDKVLCEVVKRTLSPKMMEYRLNGDGIVEQCEIEGERITQSCLTDDEIKAVAAMARRAERHYGSPQDVEWAIDAHLPAGENVILLQSRPETVWSQKKRRTVSKAGQGFMDGIVSTLVAPVHSRKKSSTVEED
ncbi:MAG: PEP/pyruvate-binding domain-containing protein [Actinomycetota bacterium]|nr:PEP/pyruvate-binding domain-containing protein [Actinomycetota bacterium]